MISFFQSPDGTQIWNVYHADANSAGACDGTRCKQVSEKILKQILMNDEDTMAQIVNWNSDGSPNFGSPAKIGTSLSGPNGE